MTMTADLMQGLAFPEDVEGYVTRAVGDMLYRFACAVPEGGLIVELGSYKGRSTICLAQSGREVWAVDHFKGEPLTALDDREHALADHTAGSYEDAFRANLRRYGVAEYVGVLRQDTHKPPPIIGDGIDLLFVDAGHDYEAVTADLAAWEPYLKATGVIIFDDANFPGVAKAMADAGQRGWRFVERTLATIAVRRKVN